MTLLFSEGYASHFPAFVCPHVQAGNESDEVDKREGSISIISRSAALLHGADIITCRMHGNWNEVGVEYFVERIYLLRGFMNTFFLQIHTGCIQDSDDC